MKKLFSLSCLTIGLFSSAFAQNTGFASRLINSKQFAFVVQKLERKQGFVAPSTSYFTSNINPSTVDMHKSMQITTYNAIDSHLLTNYYQLAAKDGSYFNAYGINTQVRNPELNNSCTSIFLIQHPDRVMVKGTSSPADMLDIHTDELNTFKGEKYKLISKKKKDNHWKLAYQVGEKQDKRVFYLDVAENGLAILKDEPTRNYSTVMYGYLISTSENL